MPKKVLIKDQVLKLRTLLETVLSFGAFPQRMYNSRISSCTIPLFSCNPSALLPSNTLLNSCVSSTTKSSVFRLFLYFTPLDFLCFGAACCSQLPICQQL